MNITKQLLKRNGFISVYAGTDHDDESAFYLRGGSVDQRWKIVIDLRMPKASYVYNPVEGSEYNGPITRVKELRAALLLCKIPFTFRTGRCD